MTGFKKVFIDTAPIIYYMDALQLATACIMGCDLFLTNDKQLRQFKEIKCVTVGELE